MKHVVIYGPQACGKTRNKAKLAKAFGCHNIMDGYSMSEIRASAARATVKTLYLTCERPGPAIRHGAEVHDYFDAMRKAGIAA